MARPDGFEFAAPAQRWAVMVLVAGLLTVAGGHAAHAAPDLLGGMREIVPAGATLEAGGQSYDTASDTTTLTDLRVAIPTQANQGTVAGSLVRCARLVVTGLDVSNPARPRAKRIGVVGLMIREASGNTSELRNGAFRDAPLAVLFADSLTRPGSRGPLTSGAVEADGFSERDVAQSRLVRVERLRSAGLEDGVFRSLMAENLELAEPSATMRVSLVEVPAVDIAAWRAAQPGAAGGRVEPGSAMTAAALRSVPSLKLRGLYVAAPEAGAQPVRIGELDYALGAERAGAWPFELKAADIEIEPPSGAEPGAGGLPGGLDALPITLAVTGSWQPGAGRLVLQPLRLFSPGAAVIELDASLTGLPDQASAYSGNAAQTSLGLGLASLESTRLRIADEGLIERWLAAFALRQGMSRAELAQAITEAAADYLRGGTSDPRRQDLLATLQQFLLRPGTLEFDFKPREPQRLLALVALAMQRPVALLMESRLSYTPPAE